MNYLSSQSDSRRQDVEQNEASKEESSVEIQQHNSSSDAKVIAASRIESDSASRGNDPLEFLSGALTAECHTGKSRRRLGWLQITILVGGTALCLTPLGFLTFLWTHQSPGEDGSNAMHIWRLVIINDWIFQTVTLCTLTVRSLFKIQSVLCTSLVASIIFERQSFPLSWSAALSVLRSVNGGPFGLLHQVFSRRREIWQQLKQVEILLLLFIFLGDMALQFSSTILFTDLQVGLFLGFPEHIPRNTTIEGGFASVLVSGLEARPSDLSLFGESYRNTFAEPNEYGFSDTGMQAHVMLPMAENRTTVRGYHGPAYVMRSRVACMPPKINKLEFRENSVPANAAPTVRRDFSISGSINFTDVLRSVGIDESPDFKNRGLTPHPVFNCTLSQEGLPSLCAFQHRYGARYPVVEWEGETYATDGWDWSWMGPWMSNPEIFLVYHTDRYRQSKDTVLPESRIPVSSDSEWHSYDGPINDRMTGRHLNVSLCFYNSNFALSHVTLQSNQNLHESPHGLKSLHDERELGLPAFLGADPEVRTPERRGTFSVKDIQDFPQNHTRAWKMGLYLEWQMTLSRKPSDELTFPTTACRWCHQDIQVWSEEYLSIWENIISLTERPAIALQVMKSLSAQSIHDQMVPYFTEPAQEAVEIRTVYKAAPARLAGLLSVLAIYTLCMLCVSLITLMYVHKTQLSHVQDGFWHVISQIAGDDSNRTARGALANGNDTSDTEVRRRLLDTDEDYLVRVRRSERTGRVELVRVDDDMEAAGSRVDTV